MQAILEVIYFVEIHLLVNTVYTLNFYKKNIINLLIVFLIPYSFSKHLYNAHSIPDAVYLRSEMKHTFSALKKLTM